MPTVQTTKAEGSRFLSAYSVDKSTAWENSRVVSDNNAILYSASLSNKGATNLYLMVFDAASLPANGTVPTMPPLLVGQTDTRSISNLPLPDKFTNGIVVAASTTQENLTVDTNSNSFFYVQYQDIS
tara:strand:+ start:107 stop:487 length:381 start_codon:yes stop_codon:yes gene_type:complete